MNIAIIAPSDATPLASEEVENLIAILGKNHRIQVYQSQVTEQKLLSALVSKVDWVWVCSHSVAEGIQLSDGVLWKTSAFARWLNNIHAELVILNTCFSISNVYEIQRYTNVDIIATILPEGIEDTEANINATYMANALTRFSDPEEALRFATSNGATQYRFFRSSATKTGSVSDSNDEITRKLLEHDRIITDHERRISINERLLKGDAELNVPSLRELIQQKNDPPNSMERGTIIISPAQVLLSFLGFGLVFLLILYIMQIMVR